MPDPGRVVRLALPLLLAACTSTASPDERELESHLPDALQTFDAVWTTVRDQHPDPELNGVDWEAVRAELRPKAAAAEDDAELRAVVNEMLGRLEQSHFGMMPRGVLPALEDAESGSGDRDTPEELAGDAGFERGTGGCWSARCGPAGPRTRRACGRDGCWWS
jgi:carboxyl-terminal processing protease